MPFYEPLFGPPLSNEIRLLEPGIHKGGYLVFGMIILGMLPLSAYGENSPLPSPMVCARCSLAIASLPNNCMSNAERIARNTLVEKSFVGVP